MRITIVGPRSVGKSTILRLLSHQLKISYISSDALMDQELKDKGGLDKAIKSGAINTAIVSKALPLLESLFLKKDFVLDLAGGAISSRKFPEIAAKIRTLIAEKSKVIGLLPFQDEKKSTSLLFSREKERSHFKNMDQKELEEKTCEDYLKLLPHMKKICTHIIYIENKSLKQIVGEISALIPSTSNI